MRKKLLFSAAMLIVAAGAMAQSDITPSRYKFANLPEGPFTIDNCSTGWGPGNVTDARASENGYVNATGGAFWTGKYTDAFKNFQSGWQILDLTEEGIGKVLCFKGSGCSDDILAKGTKATGTNVPWPQLAFYSDPKNTPTASGEEGAVAPFIRLSITYKAMENELSDTGSPITALEVKAVEPNEVKNSYGGPFNTSDMMVKDMATEEMFELNEGWQKVEYDFQIGTPTGNPFAISIKMDGAKLDKGAILIKEIKFLTPSDGTYAKGQPANVQTKLTFKEGGSGINDEIVEGNTIQCRVLDNVLSVSNLKTGDKIELYSAAGALVASQVATSNKETLPLNGKGFYIVRVGTTSVKVTNN